MLMLSEKVKVKEARYHKRPHIIWLHLWEMSHVLLYGKSTETESGLAVARGRKVSRHEGGNGE